MECHFSRKLLSGICLQSNPITTLFLLFDLQSDLSRHSRDLCSLKRLGWLILIKKGLLIRLSSVRALPHVILSLQAEVEKYMWLGRRIRYEWKPVVIRDYEQPERASISFFLCSSERVTEKVPAPFQYTNRHAAMERWFSDSDGMEDPVLVPSPKYLYSHSDKLLSMSHPLVLVQ